MGDDADERRLYLLQNESASLKDLNEHKVFRAKVQYIFTDDGFDRC